MAKKNKKQQTKKVIEINIFKQLNVSLSEYHSLVGEKKFTKHLKKTAKLFANDISNATKREQEKLEKETKKTAKKDKKTAFKNNKIAVKKATLKKKVEKKVDSKTPEVVVPEIEKQAE